MKNEEKCKAVVERIFLKDLSECEYFPKYVTIETVDGCNARCIMCPRGKENTKFFIIWMMRHLTGLLKN